MGIINRTLKPSQVQKHTRRRIYNTSALPCLLYGYGCETWAIRERYIWDNINRNEIYEKNSKIHMARLQNQ